MKARASLVGIFSGIIAFLAMYFLVDFPTEAMRAMASIVSLMFVWWITEAIPLGATGLIPVVLYPVFGILSTKEVAKSYINSTIFLFIGGFLIARAMEKTNLHKVIAVKILSVVGKSPVNILLGFMVASYFLSMWISNTATTLMMLPIALSIVSSVEKRNKVFVEYLLMAIAYASSIGGIATLVGTAPNLSFQRIFSIIFPEAPEISFGQWFLVGSPISLSMLILTFLFLVFVVKTSSKGGLPELSLNLQEAKLSFSQRIVLGVFIITALLWLFRKDLVIGNFKVPGWSNLFKYSKYIDDGTVAIFMSLLLFLLPADKKFSGRIANRESILNLPWDLLLLFGGGFAIATGFRASGLDKFVGEQFTFLAGVPTFFIVLFICLGVTFLTELTSNTATTEMLLPILAPMAISIGVNPLLLMLPATISASYAFMMPISTPPNAIVFGSGKIRIKTMIKTGFVLNILGAILLTLWLYFYARGMFDISEGLPAWAK